MSRRRKSKGERRHGAGWEVYVRIDGDLRRTQFPLDSTPGEREAWRIAQRHTAALPLPTGSLGRDAVRWLRAVKHQPDAANKRTYMLHWCQKLGTQTPRRSLTSQQIQTALSDWLAEGYSPTTVRHHRTALKQLFAFCDGPRAHNPVDDTTRPRDPDPEVRDVRLDHIRQLLARMPASKTRARLALILATGLPHAQIMRLQPDDWDRDLSLLRVTRRKKGGGTAGRLLPLSPAGVSAMRAFHQADAYGPFSQSAMHSAVHRYCDLLGIPRFRPYDLRHVHGALTYLETGDLTTTARMLGHSSTKTAERYAQSAFARVDARTAAKVGRSLAGVLATRRNRPKNR